jgi:hypothetical protein
MLTLVSVGNGSLATKDGHGNLRAGKFASLHVAWLESYIGHHQAGGGKYDLPDDTFPEGEHGVQRGWLFIEAAAGNAGNDFLGALMPAVRQILVEHEDARGIVIQHRFDGIQQVFHDYVEVERVAHFLRDIEQQLVLLFIG